jgi:hypothetical protein
MNTDHLVTLSPSPLVTLLAPAPDSGRSEESHLGGFDADIGNRPYVRVQALNEWGPLDIEYYKQRYQSANKGNYGIGFAIPLDFRDCRCYIDGERT